MTLLRSIFSAMRRLDDHWLGDLLGGLSLFATAYIAFFFAGICGGN